MPEVDALTIATPNDLHAGMALKAVQAGKAVMVEKPLCITRDELRQLELVLPSAGVPFHLGYRLRFNSEIQRLCRPEGVRAVPRRYIAATNWALTGWLPEKLDARVGA